MRSMMEELYMGNVGFDGGHYAPDSPFVKAAKRQWESMQQLNRLLDSDGKDLFEQYCEASGEIEEIARYDTYASTLKFGLLLMAEILMEHR